MLVNHFSYDNNRRQGEWRLAEPRDIPRITALTYDNFRAEAAPIFTPDIAYFQWQLDKALTNQRHNMATELVIIAEDASRLLAWTWIERGHRTLWSQEEMAEPKVIHLDLTLSARDRIHLLKDTMAHWERWASACDIPIIVSSSVREEQTAFMKLHRQAGYTVRGSFAWKRLYKGERE
jgi:hypothetical protein